MRRPRPCPYGTDGAPGLHFRRLSANGVHQSAHRGYRQSHSLSHVESRTRVASQTCPRSRPIASSGDVRANSPPHAAAGVVPIRSCDSASPGPTPRSRGHLMRTPGRAMGSICQTGQPLILVAPQPSMHRLTRDAEATRHLDHRHTIADHRQHRLIPLLHDTQLHQHARECVTDQAEPASPVRRSRVTHQPEPMRHASGGTTHWAVGRAGLEPATEGL